MAYSTGSSKDWYHTRTADRLFGRYLERERRLACLSSELLADAARRQQRWLDAVESGQISLTKPSLEMLSAAWENCGLRWRDFSTIYADLRSNPSSPLALELIPFEQQIKLEEHGELDGWDDEGDLFPLFAGLAPTDRVLVLFPVLLTVMALLGCYLVFAFYEEVPKPPRLTATETLLIATGVLIFVLPFTQPLGFLFDRLAELFRTDAAKTELNRSIEAATQAGIELSDRKRWYQPELLPYCHPAVRTDVAQQGFELELFERIRPVASFAFTAFSLVWLVAVDDKISAAGGLFAVPVVLVLALRVVLGIQFRKNTQSFRSAVQDALGVSRRTASNQMVLDFN